MQNRDSYSIDFEWNFLLNKMILGMQIMALTSIVVEWNFLLIK